MGNLVREASMAALREAIRGGVGCRSSAVVEERHFEKAFASVKPSVGEKERTRYEALKVKYGQTSEGDEMMKTMIGQQQNVSSPNTELANGLAEASKPGVAQLSTSGVTHHVQDNVVEVEEEERNVSTSPPPDGKNDFDAAKQLPEKETAHENTTQEMKSTVDEERTTGDVK